MTNTSKKVLKVCECAILIGLAIVFDILSKVIFGFINGIWVNGGGITIAMIPIVFVSLRHGWIWGTATAFIYSVIQMVTGWWPPPAGTFWAFVGVVMLDYVLAYTILGLAALFAKPFKNKLLGYGFGAFIVCLLRFIFSGTSGVIIWESTVEWGFTNIWAYSFVYNISYMLPNAVITAGIIIALCAVFDPKTLKRNIK